MRLLLLTKVPLYEENFERQLKQLGNEVYCSSQLTTQLPKENFNHQLLNQFEGVIFSETLYDKEVEELIQLLSGRRHKLFRRTLDVACDEKCSDFDGWIPVNADLERLRETLLIAEMSRLALKNADHIQQITIKQKLSSLNLKLKQKEIVYYLIQAGNRTVPREEISRQIWGKEPTKSILASLSKVVSKVNEKLVNDFGDEVIQTVWGQGYRLNNNVFDYLENDFVDRQEVTTVVEG